MATCAFCGSTVKLPHECSECGVHLCDEHRLPEAHDCDRRLQKNQTQDRIEVSRRQVIGAGSIAVLGVAYQQNWLESFDRHLNGLVSGVRDMLDHSDELAEKAEEMEQMIHERVNVQRKNHSLHPLEYSSKLEDVADYHSEDMLEKEYYAHESPSGETPQKRYVKFNIPCRGGENLMKSYQVTEDAGELSSYIVQTWMGSPGHRQNILYPEYIAEGIGVKFGKEDGQLVVVVTQNFC